MKIKSLIIVIASFVLGTIIWKITPLFLNDKQDFWATIGAFVLVAIGCVVAWIVDKRRKI